MSKYTIEFKSKNGKSWKIFQSGNLKYKNVDYSTLDKIMPDLYDTKVMKGIKIRIFKDGKVWETFEDGVEKITLHMPMMEEDKIEAEMEKQRRRTKREFKSLGWDE